MSAQVNEGTSSRNEASPIAGNVDVALAWAAAGVPVFPCQWKEGSYQKAPLISRDWKVLGSTDEKAIRDWWRRWPNALVGINLAGQRILIIDVDGSEGERQWAAMVDQYGDAGAPFVKTPGGGRHFAFRLPEGVEHGNGLGRLLAKREGGMIDVRGPGKGYIIGAGSMLPDGRLYQAIGTDVTSILAAPEIPAWLLDILKGSCHEAAQEAAQTCVEHNPAPAPSRTPSVASAPNRGDHSRVLAWSREGFRRELDAVRNAPEGNRNNQLNESSFNVGQLVGRSFIDRGDAENALIQAATDNGYGVEDQTGMGKTIRSGLDAGVRQPRAIPWHIEVGIRDDEEAAELGRRAAMPALVHPADGTRYDPEAGEVIEAPQSGVSRLQLIGFDDIEPVIDQRDFVQGLLIENTVVLAFGESNVGKSFWGTNLALHVAAGLPWNDRRVERGAVLYLAMEGGAGFKNRVAAWKATHRVDGPVHFAAVTAPLNLRQSKDVRALVEAVEQARKGFDCPVKLIVVDTVSRALAGADENSSADMGSFVQGIDLIREKTGAAILLIHHSGKDTSRGARGHSLLRAAVDTEIEITADDTTGFRTAKVTKQRDLDRGFAISFRLEAMELGENRHGEKVTSCTVVPGNQNDLCVNDRGKRVKRLPDDLEALLRTIQALIIDEGVMGHPSPGMPAVKYVFRRSLRARLLANGWICLPEGEDGVTNRVSDGVAKSETYIPKSEHQRLHKKLAALQNKGKIGFDRRFIWVV